MTWANFLDTFLNVVTIGFIGVLLWLYLRDEGDDNA
jgi:hypothetical protein